METKPNFPSQWNRGTPTAKLPRKPPSKLRGLVAFLILIALAGGAAWYLLMPADRGKVEIKPSGSVLIKDVGKTNAVKKVAEKVLTPEEKEKRRRAAGGMYTNKYGYVYNRPSTRVVTTNRADDIVIKTLAEKVFTNAADQRIGNLISTEPGTRFFGDASTLYGPSFTRKFLDSLTEPIIISTDDPPEVAELKRAVRETKIELKARYDSGEDIGKIMLGARKELEALGLYKDELTQEIEKISKNRDLSEEEVGDFVKAANKMLAERGMKPLAMPRMAARRFEYLRHLKEQEKEKQQ